MNKLISAVKKSKKSETKSGKKVIPDINPYISKSLSGLVKAEKSPKSQFWLFDIFDYNKKMPNGRTKLENLYNAIKLDVVRYIVFQSEICPETKNKHLQGYIELNEQVRRKRLQEEILKCGKHWCQARGDKNNKRSISYCQKPNSDWPASNSDYDCYDTESNIRYESGNKDMTQGNRSDLGKIIDKIKNGESLKSALDGNEETYVRNYNGLRNLEYMLDKPRELSDPLEVEVYYGAAGTGKSHKAYHENDKDSIFPVPPSEKYKWYTGYDNKKHTVVLYNDFNGSRMQRTTLLELTDIYPIQVETKGSLIHFKPKKIILTSNDNPLDWYECDENKKLALIRRFTKILEFQYVTGDMEIDKGTKIYKNKDGLKYQIIDRTKEIKENTLKEYTLKQRQRPNMYDNNAFNFDEGVDKTDYRIYQ